MHPDQQNWQIDRRNGPKHQNEDGMDVIAEVVVCDGTDVGGETAGASTSCDLHKTGDEICELVRDERGDEEEEDAAREFERLH